MAKILFGNGVAAMSGSVAGNVYSKNANGAYVRNKGTVANRNTIPQQAARMIFAAISRGWAALSAANKQSFIDQVANYPFTNALGETQIFTGKQLYSKLNNTLASAQQSIISTCLPPINALPTVINVDIASLTNITTTFSTGLQEVPANCVAVIMATTGFTKGKYRPKRPDFKQIEVLNAGDGTDNKDYSTAYLSVFGVAPAAGQRVFYALFVVSKTTGQKTAYNYGSFTV